MTLIGKIRNVVPQLYGWKTKKKIIVFESDDWGSIRMPSINAFNYLLKNNIITDKRAYARFDSLESDYDLTKLFSILCSFKDYTGNHPVFTLNYIMANPDFLKIRESHFSSYFYEPFQNSLDFYGDSNNYFSILEEAIRIGVAFPQLHGREHVNVGRWMHKLFYRDFRYISAFDFNSFYVKPLPSDFFGKSIFASLDYDDELSLLGQIDSLQEAFDLFYKAFGFLSKSFVAPNYIWSSFHEERLSKLGIQYIQGTKFQNIPVSSSQSYRRSFRYIGKRNNFNQISIVRNCFFEPSVRLSFDVVSECLNQISTAFNLSKPAVISTHRLNFISRLDIKNSDRNLKLLEYLLDEILKQWPDAVFMNTVQLGDIIKADL
jgi:hypothetical protein